MQNLKQKTLKGIYWSVIDSFGLFFIRFVFSILIARLLSPEDYGVMGMMAIFIALANMIAESGLSMALIQRKNVSDQDYSTVFFFNLGVSILLFIILFLAAPLIALFFEEPRLINVARITSLSIIIGSLSTIQLTILGKNLNFKSQAKINIPSALVSGSTGLTLAHLGFGVYALIFQTLAGALFRSVFYWIISSWKPSILFSFDSFKKLFGYGWKIFLQRLAETVSRNIYQPIIGKVFSTEMLGYYTRAKNFQEMVVVQFSTIFQKVIFPAFSSIQDDDEKVLLNSSIGFGILTLFLPIIVMILVVSAEPFVVVLLTNKWIAIIPLLKILYLEGLFYPLYVYNWSLINSLGNSSITLRLEIFMKIFIFISIPVGVYFGIRGLLITIVLVSCLGYFVSLFFLQKIIKGFMKDQLSLLSFPYLIVFISLFLIELRGSFLSGNNRVLISFLIFYVLLYYYIAKLFKVKNYLYFKSLLSQFIPSKYLLFLNQII